MPRWRGRANVYLHATVVSRGDGVLVESNSLPLLQRRGDVEATAWSHEDAIDASRRESGLY